MARKPKQSGAQAALIEVAPSVQPDAVHFDEFDDAPADTGKTSPGAQLRDLLAEAGITTAEQLVRHCYVGTVEACRDFLAGNGPPPAPVFCDYRCAAFTPTQSERALDLAARARDAWWGRKRTRQTGAHGR